MTRPNTPGFFGYALAILVSWAVLLSILVALSWWFTEDLADPDLSLLPYFVTGTVALGTPIGAVGALLVHLCCHREPSQVLHVFAAGAAGIGVPVVAVFLVQPSTVTELALEVLITLPISLAAMVGRAAVIPLVTARRAQLASARPLQVP